MEKVVVLGGGGHAKVVVDVLKSAGIYQIAGFVAREPAAIMDIPHLGDDAVLSELLNKGVSNFIVAIGDNRIRKLLFEKTLSLGFKAVNAISPHAYVSPYAKIGQGVVIMAGAVIQPYTLIEDNVIINTLSGVDHDCAISSHSHIAPGTSLTGNITVEEGAFVGTGSKVIPDITVGKWSVVGAGAVVISDVPPFTKVVGIPANKIINKG